MTNSKLLPPAEVAHNQKLVMRFMHRKQHVKNLNAVNSSRRKASNQQLEPAFKPVYYVDEDDDTLKVSPRKEAS